MEITDFIIYILFCVVVLPLGVVVNRKLYKKIKNEEHKEKGKVVQYILIHYLWFQCIIWPALAAFLGVFRLYNVVFKTIKGSWARSIIASFRFVYGFNRDYVSFNSLIIATARYVVLTFERQAESFGVKRLKTVLVTSSIGVPIISSILYELTQPTEQVYISFFSYNISFAKEDNSNTSLNASFRSNLYDSPVYVSFNSNVPRAVVDVLRILSDIMHIVLYSNVIEGCIYTHLFIVYIR
jgi:hypothetical protein